MDITKYLYELNVIYTDTLDSSSELDYNGIIDKTLHMLDMYGNVIRTFFSTDDGEANNIKNIYKKLEDLEYSSNKIVGIIDIQGKYETYFEYYTGMIKFINDIINSAYNSKDLSLYDKQIKTAEKCDPDFISSLFKNNDVELTNSTYIFDELVELYNHIYSDFKLSVKNLSLDPESDFENATVNTALLLMMKSINNYCNKFIETTITSYNSIYNTLYDIDDISDSAKLSSNTSNFKLF